MDTLNTIIQCLKSFCSQVYEILKFLNAYQNYLMALVIVLLILLIIIRLKRHFSPIKLFDNNNGIVTLKRKALHSLVESVCYNMGSLTKPKIAIYVKRRKLFLSVSLKIESEQRLVDFTSKLQEEIQNAFIQQLGIEKIGKIDININEFRGLQKKPLSHYQKHIEPKAPTSSTPESSNSADSEI
ncbi:MAG: hypothetical protein R3Y46_06010 [Opitutales bacterium]